MIEKKRGGICILQTNLDQCYCSITLNGVPVWMSLITHWASWSFEEEERSPTPQNCTEADGKRENEQQ